jgi:nicotinamidase-related amidase
MIVPADPYDFPITGPLVPASTALVIIDMQRDFCDPEGYSGRRGDDVGAARAVIPRIAAVRDAARRLGMPVIYTREGHRPDLSDLPEAKRCKTGRSGAMIGSSGPLGRLLVRGQMGWEIVRELEPASGEIVIDKPGTGAFYATDLQHVLAGNRVENLVLTGVTTGVCVSSTAREAADRGYGVLVLEDACAEPDPRNHAMALALLKIEGGYIATVATTDAFLRSAQ